KQQPSTQSPHRRSSWGAGRTWKRYFWIDRATGGAALFPRGARANRGVERGSGPMYREGFNVPLSGRSFTQGFRPTGTCSLRRMVGLRFRATDSVQFSLDGWFFDNNQADPSQNEQRCEQETQRN